MQPVFDSNSEAEMIAQNTRRLLAVALFAMGASVLTCELMAAGGTAVVASPGQPAYISPTWPAGVGELINDPARTHGWNSWFTEWPNDVHQYAFEIQSMDDLNRLIQKLATVNGELKQVRVCHLKEPRGLGWVTQLDKGNAIPVIFSIGDQEQINQWYGQVRKPFGVMEFKAAPIAVPPTLTIFVRHPTVNLLELKIPDGIEVTEGYVPSVFHKSNLVGEDDRPAPAAAVQAADVEPDEQAARDAIRVFLKARQKPAG